MTTNELRYKQLLVTDWSGVASDDRRIVAEANSRMLVRRNRPPVSFEEWKLCASTSAHAFLESKGVYGEDERHVQAEYQATYSALRRESWLPTLIPGAKAYFENRKAEKRINLILSSHPLIELERELKEYGMEALFSEVVGDVHDKGAGLKRLIGTRAQHTAAYTGDMRKDVMAAKTAGIMGIGVASGYEARAVLETSNPDLLVDSLTELDLLFVAAKLDA